MPLSKTRDKERKRKSKFQPKPSDKTPTFQPKTFGYATKDVPKPKWMI